MDRDCLGPASWVNPPPSDSCLCAKGCRDKHFLARFMSRSLPSCPTEMPEKGLPQLMLQSWPRIGLRELMQPHKLTW